MTRPPRPTFRELYAKYRSEGTPRWLYLLYFILLLAGAIVVYLKLPACWRGGHDHSQPCGECTKPSEPPPAPPKILKYY